MLLFYTYRVYERGRRYRAGIYILRIYIYIYIFVKTVLPILFEGFTSILSFVGFFPSRSYRLTLVWKIYTEIEKDRYGIGT